MAEKSQDKYKDLKYQLEEMKKNKESVLMHFGTKGMKYYQKIVGRVSNCYLDVSCSIRNQYFIKFSTLIILGPEYKFEKYDPTKTLLSPEIALFQAESHPSIRRNNIVTDGSYYVNLQDVHIDRRLEMGPL